MVVDIIKIIDRLLFDEDIDFKKVKRGGNFLFTLKRDKLGLRKLLDKFKMDIDMKGLTSGNILVPLTISILNKKDDIPGEEIYVGVASFRVHYYGISPELENFVVLVLWPEYSRHSRKTLEEIWKEIKNSQKECVLKLEGNYKLRLPNEVHPFRAENIVTEERKLYKWMYVPYIKEVGETISSYVSPINFRKVYVRDLRGDYKKKYVNPKACVGIVKRVSGGYIAIKLPYLDYKNIKGYYNVPYHYSIRNKVKSLKPGDKIAFLIFEEIDSEDKQRRIPSPVVYDISKIDSAHILGHILSYILYNYYLVKKRLLVISYSGYKELFGHVMEIVSRFCKNVSDVNVQFLKDEFIFSAFLRPFFQLIEKNIFYIPAFLGSDLEKVVYFDKKLSTKSENIDKYCLHEKFEIIEYNKNSNLIFCPLYKIKIREEANLCKHCKYYYLSKDGIALQNTYRFLRFILEVKSFLYSERLEKFVQLIDEISGK